MEAVTIGVKNWYVLHTLSGQESRVKANLERKMKALGLEDRIFRIVVPVEEEVKVRSGKKRRIRHKVFPGYVFIEMMMDDEIWFIVRNTAGVTGFVGAPTAPIALHEREAAKIVRLLGEEVPRVKATWLKGEIVRVVSGPFADFMGRVEHIDLAKEKLRILISIFGRDTPVELDFTQVEKV